MERGVPGRPKSDRGKRKRFGNRRTGNATCYRRYGRGGIEKEEEEEERDEADVPKRITGKSLSVDPRGSNDANGGFAARIYRRCKSAAASFNSVKNISAYRAHAMRLLDVTRRYATARCPDDKQTGDVRSSFVGISRA